MSLSLSPNLQCGQRGSLRSRQTSRWCGARGWSCPVLSSTTLALFSGPKMAWHWALERTCRVRHHTASSGILLCVQHVTKICFSGADSDIFGLVLQTGKHLCCIFKAIEVELLLWSSNCDLAWATHKIFQRWTNLNFLTLKVIEIQKHDCFDQWISTIHRGVYEPHHVATSQ